MPLKKRAAFNLVELLITLSIVALLTTVIFNAVNDYRDKLRTVIVKNDLITLAQMCKYVESIERTLVSSVSTGATELTSDLNNYIIKIPAEDPWGYQYYIDPVDSTVHTTNNGGMAYIVDKGLGRIISPGPDGVCDTRIGYGQSDTDRDIVVEYRQSQWLIFNLQKKIYLSKGDGSFDPIFIYAGDKLRVSPDRQKFVCVDAANVLTWGLIDQNPNVKQLMHLGTGLDTTFNNNGSLYFPFWAPDSVHILYTKYVPAFTACDIYSLNTATSETIRLTRDAPIPYDTAYFNGGINYKSSIFNDGRCSSYQNIDATVAKHDVAITVSLDGKVAFYNKNKASLDMVLLNGTGYRTVCVDTTILDPDNRKRFRPLFWLDTETIIYLDKNHDYIYRVRQDGTYRIPLYAKMQNGVDLTTADSFSAFSLSPDRRFIGFSVDKAGVPYYRILRTDGAGCVISGAAVDSPYSAVGAGGRHALWPKREILLPNGEKERRVFPSTDTSTGSLATFQEIVLKDGGKIIEWSAMGPQYDNPDTGIVPFSWDLDKSENLIAAGSWSDGKAGLLDGIFVYSIGGPAGAVTNITKTFPDSDRIPTDGSAYVGVFWIE
jgi:type II secretory pathway pseudopilin PulG